MDYVSTRNKERKVSAAYAIANGIAPDGGLYCPTAFPALTDADWKTLAESDYKGRSALILGKFLTDFTAEELADFASKAYADEKFGGADTAPVVKLGEGKNLLELWHGPTCAFKDMALQILPHLLTTAMKKTGEKDEVVILVATSGDTGKAALEGFRDVAGTRIIVFYPDNGVSEIQKLQMITQEGNNVSVCAVDGNFDDAQNGVKRIFTDKKYGELLLANQFKLSSANSINWGRLVPQIVYYFSAYADMLAAEEIEVGEEINVVVPTGNFGNILASYYAYKMGLPVHRFICASNENNVLTDFINTGVYNKNRQFHTTISPSMDILISSNLERFLYHISGRDDAFIRDIMAKLSTDGVYVISDELKLKIRSKFSAGCADDAETMAQIRKTSEDYGYVMDTHTAVGKAVYDKYVAETGDDTKTVIASTASPFKFNQSVLIALGGNAAVCGKDEFELLGELSERSGMKIPQSLAELKTKPRIFESVCEKDEMVNMVNDFLQI